jgi:hypothetical protein
MCRNGNQEPARYSANACDNMVLNRKCERCRVAKRYMQLSSTRNADEGVPIDVRKSGKDDRGSHCECCLQRTKSPFENLME